MLGGFLRKGMPLTMSAIGTERRFWNVRTTVAFGGKADVTRTWGKRRF
jgi:hypothetical protein